MLVVTSMIIIYTSAMSFFAVSKVESSIRNLEEKNAKIVLKKITLIVNTVYKDLENLKKVTLEHNKNKLRNLTDTIWSVIQTKYEQSKPQNVGIILKKRSQEFKSDLTKFYNDNKDKISERELKKNLINYINIHRYNNGTGYFWVNDFIPNMIVHPIVKELNGKYLGDYKDPNGVYLFTEMVSKVQTNDTGLVRYQWLNPKSKEVEDKISYVFKFEPFNWIIGTGEYYSVLKQRLQKEVITLVNKVKYENNNYFYISDYNNKIISHPYLQGKDFSSIRDINGTLIIPPLINIARQKGEGFHSYWWKMNNSDTSYEKITFAKDFPDWEMVIGTGIYINQIKDEIKKRKKELMSQLREIIKST
jgi:methyl-accepting chemotaxis protein